MRAPAVLILLVLGVLGAAILWPGNPEPQAGPARAESDPARDTAAGEPLIEASSRAPRTRASAAPEPSSSAVTEIPADASEPPPFTIEGIVLERRPDGTLEPFAGRPLVVGPGSPGVEGASGADGRFRIVLPRRGVGPASVMLQAPEVDGSPCAPWSRRFDFEPGVSAIRGVRVVLQLTPALVGIVVDINGASVEGARITLEGATVTDATDADGRFDLGPWPGLDLHLPDSIEAKVHCALAGFTVLDVECPGYDADDVWQPMRIVGAPTGTLEVRVLSADGAPLAGEYVRVHVAQEEPWRASERNALGFSLRAQRTTTGKDGVARFDDAPAGPFLDVETLDARFVWMRAGELLEDAGRGAVPIAVRPGEPLALVLREAPSVSITGQVLEPDGTPSPKAYVRFTDARDEWIADPLRADEDGRFSARVPREACDGALVVSAQSAVGEEPTYSPFGGRKYVPNFAFGRVAVDVPPEGAVDVTVRCTPSIDVTGTVHGPDGEPVRSAQALLVRDGDVSRRRLPSGEWARTRLFLGQFHFRGVDSGTFRVHVRSEELGLLVSEPFEASGEPLALRYGGRSVARVVATVVGVESPEHAHLELEYGAIDFLGSPDALPVLSNGARFGAGAGDPRAALGLPSDRRATHTSDLSVDLLGRSVRAGEPLEILLAPGPCVLGVRGTDGLGRTLAPVGTGLVRVDAGEIHVTFAPVTTGLLRVVVPDARPGECFEVRSADGELLAPVAGTGPVVTRARLPRSGIREVRVARGTVRVAVGSPTELDRAAPRRTFRVDVE